ncbi:MAG: signal recognition particle-docking protein FtsY [Candidatus Bathyarchaeia archaeon]
MFEKFKAQINDLLDKITKTELKGKKLEEFIEEFKFTLLENDVAFSVAEEICKKLKNEIEGLAVPRIGEKKEPIKNTLKGILFNVLNPSIGKNLMEIVKAKREIGEPTVLLFVGINGTGKTTTIAKLSNLLLKSGFSVVIACSDTYRSGSIEQLEEHAKRVGVKTIKHRYGADAAAVAFDAINYAKAHGINVVLIDTAGRMQTNRNLLDEMKKIVRVTNPDMVILVVDALTGNDAVEQGRIFSEAIRIDGIILTKLDADAKGGSAISLSYIIGKPILYLGVGQSYDDLIPFDPSFIIKNILEK